MRPPAPSAADSSGSGNDYQYSGGVTLPVRPAR